MNIYDIKVLDQKQNEISLDIYKGKVLLIVNTATGCGYTPQYAELQTLYNKYKDKGLEILDFPCNQFANQASGTNEEIYAYCQGRFGITFKQFAKIDVNGKNVSPLFKYLKDKSSSLFGRRIKWNFTKFLVDKEGHVISRFAPNITPLAIEESIIKLL